MAKQPWFPMRMTAHLLDEPRRLLLGGGVLREAEGVEQVERNRVDLARQTEDVVSRWCYSL